MSKSNHSLSNKEIAQYLDQEIPLHQLDNKLMSDEPTFLDAQLAFAKSKQGKTAKRKNKKCFEGGKK